MPARRTNPVVRLIAVATAMNILGYMDRVCISVAAPRLSAEYGFTPAQMGVIFGAFSLSYALFQAPWGGLADRVGARPIVAAAVLCWSGFTALTACAWGFASLTATRFLFGISEAAISPAVASAFKRVVPEQRRSTAFGFFLGGGRVGGAAAPIIAAFFIACWGWRSMFFCFAALGVIFFAVWMKAAPGDRPRVPPQPPEGPRPASGIVSLPLIALLAVSFSYTMMWQFYATWFPTYLVEARGFTLQQAGGFASLPFLLGLFSTWIGGMAADRMTRVFGAQRGRIFLGTVSLLISALAVYTGMLTLSRGPAAILIAMGAGFGDLILASSWAVAVERGGQAAGVVAGLMNSVGNLGGFLSPVATGWLLGRSHNWRIVLGAAAAANVFAAVCWIFANRPGHAAQGSKSEL